MNDRGPLDAVSIERIRDGDVQNIKRRHCIFQKNQSAPGGRVSQDRRRRDGALPWDDDALLLARDGGKHPASAKIIIT